MALCGGLALYFLAHVAMRVRLVSRIRCETPGRLARPARGRRHAGGPPAALALPALAALALGAALCWALIAWNVLHYRAHRSEVRRARP